MKELKTIKDFHVGKTVTLFRKDSKYGWIQKLDEYLGKKFKIVDINFTKPEWIVLENASWRYPIECFIKYKKPKWKSVWKD